MPDGCILPRFLGCSTVLSAVKMTDGRMGDFNEVKRSITRRILLRLYVWVDLYCLYFSLAVYQSAWLAWADGWLTGGWRDGLAGLALDLWSV